MIQERGISDLYIHVQVFRRVVYTNKRLQTNKLLLKRFKRTTASRVSEGRLGVLLVVESSLNTLQWNITTATHTR